MKNEGIAKAFTHTNIAEMRKALQDPGTDVGKHAIAAVRTIRQEDDYIMVQIAFDHQIAQKENRNPFLSAHEYEKVMQLTIRYTPTATIRYPNIITMRQQDYPLTTEEQQTLDDYVQQASSQLAALAKVRFLESDFQDANQAEPDTRKQLAKLRGLLAEAQVITQYLSTRQPSQPPKPPGGAAAPDSSTRAVLDKRPGDDRARNPKRTDPAL